MDYIVFKTHVGYYLFKTEQVQKIKEKVQFFKKNKIAYKVSFLSKNKLGGYINANVNNYKSEAAIKL